MSANCIRGANCASGRCDWRGTLGAPGTRIAIASENRPEIIELMFATWAAECVVVPINYKLHPREMEQILDDAEVVAGVRVAEDR